MSIQLEEKRGWVNRFFSETGSSYDEVVKYFTFGIDGLWKKKMLAQIPESRALLDLACGTGILTFAIKQKYPDCHIIGVDITEGYLAVARQKALARSISDVEFVLSPAEDFDPLLNVSRFDCVTSSYLPKYAEIPKLIRNIHQMLKPSGRLVLHDFTYPDSKLLQKTFELYFKCARPVGAFFYPSWKEVLVELPRVIRDSDWVSEVSTAMENEGFTDIQVSSLTLQGAALITGNKR